MNLMKCFAHVPQDVRGAVRGFRRNAGFSIVVILVLALGIGGTSAIYSVADAVLWSPLPYPHPEKLVRIVDNVPAEESPSGASFRTSTMTQDAFLWWRDNAKTLAGIASYLPSGLTAKLGAETVRLAGARVSPSLFDVLSVQPSVGRAFKEIDDEAAPVMMVSTRLAARLSPVPGDVVGRTLILEGVAHTIVGVMPRDFEFPTKDTDVWTRYAVGPDSANKVITLETFARVKDGVPMSAVTAEITALGARFVGASLPGSPNAVSSPRFDVVEMQEYLIAPVRNGVRLLMASVAILLLIVCSNVANLLMSKGWGRSQEFWIRRALGAARPRLVRQLLTEGMVLALAAGIVSVGVAVGGVRVIQWLAVVARPQLYGGDTVLLPGIARLGVDRGVFAFTLVVSIVTGLLFSLMPALQLSALGSQPRRTRKALTVVELALATSLMIGAGLLLHSLQRLSSVDAGYDPAGVLTFQFIAPPGSTSDRNLALAGDLAHRLEAIPGVRRVGFTGGAPLSTWQEGWGLTPHGAKPEAGLSPRGLNAQARRVSSGYLRSIGARLVAGRWLEERDALAKPSALIINRALASRYFGDINPVGREVDLGRQPWVVAGVVENLRNNGLDVDAEPQGYIDPIAMQARAREAGWIDFPSAPEMLSFAVKVDNDPLQIVDTVRRAVRQIEPSATIDGVVPMGTILSSSLARPRFYAVLPALLAAIAGIVAVFGIYGVLSHGVALRTKEFGIRMAIGATPGQVKGLVLREAGVLAVFGIGIGVAGALGLTRYLTGLLFGTTPLDPLTFVAVPVGFAIVSMFASYLPSRQATRVDPMNALRHE